MKRVVSLLFILSFLLAPSTCPTVFAAGTDSEGAAQALYELGLFWRVGGDENSKSTFALDCSPTRNEAAVMVVRLLGKEDEALSKNWTTPFTDLADWAKPYVGYAYSHGIISGVSKTEYDGESFISAAQFLTLVLRILGYQSSEDFQWDRAWELADEIGLTHGEYYGSARNFTRGDMAEISLSALSLPNKKDGLTMLEKMNGYDPLLVENLENLYGCQVLQEDPTSLSAYHIIRKAILSYDGSKNCETVEFPMELTQPQLETAWVAFRGDYPQCFWFSPYTPRIETTDGKSRIQVEYSYSSLDEFREAKETFDRCVKSTLVKAGIDMEMDDITKESLLYTYLGRHIRYDHEQAEDMQQSAYRAIVEHRGVCLSIANAFTYLLQQAGVMAHVAEGTIISSGANHAWTLVRLEGDYYYCDLTWDSHSRTDSTLYVTGNYFNLSSEKLENLDHRLSGFYPMPLGGNTNRDLFENNGGLVTEMTVDAAVKAFKQKMFELDDGRTIIPIYVADELGNLDDFHAWWGEDNNRNCWDIIKGAGLYPCSVAEIARLGNLWLLVAEPV